MQAIDWNALRYVLAVSRAGSCSAAARQLGVDATTVSRRLRAVEAALGTRLFERDADGRMRPTQAGEIAARRAEAMEAEVGDLALVVQGAGGLVQGTVRVTAVPILVNRVLLPAVPALLTRHPDLRLELIADPRDARLMRREADIALRLARPGEDAGSRILARRLGTVAYAAYAASPRVATTSPLPWLGYDEGMSHLPQAGWIARAAEREGGLAAVALNDADGLLHAVQAGLGRSMLPCIVGDRIPGLARLQSGDEAMPARELWLLSHPDLRHLARIVAVVAWIEASVALAPGVPADAPIRPSRPAPGDGA
jgi:DNA-binding transcriptional LysR family regulator